MKTAIWWIRRDIRVQHNPTLLEAIRAANELVPVFILDPAILRQEPGKRDHFLFQALHSLDQELRSLGSKLLLLEGEPSQELKRLADHIHAAMIYAEEDYSPYARKRDQRVATALPLCLVHGLTAFPPGMVIKNDGTPYTIFTPYKTAWLNLPLMNRPSLQNRLEKLPSLPASLPVSQPLPDFTPQPEFPANHAEAERRLTAFLSEKLHEYGLKRDRMDVDGTSRLSPYLRFGLLSSQVILQQVRSILPGLPEQGRKQAEIWQNELIWREFYISILHHFPEVMQASFRKDLRNIRWRNDQNHLLAWQNGSTGYPIVDAGMRQLLTTGWMHNRARMITASFLVKDLLINWQAGEEWFMKQLVDGDPAANNGGWQWTAGVGTDAAPYFRIFNPVLQSKKFDPQGDYIRRWVPELASVPEPYIHSPWLMPDSMQHQTGCVIGKQYPYPIVNHQEMREQVLTAYRAR